MQTIEVIFNMAHKNPWVLITWNELHMIQKGLYTLEKEILMASSKYIGEMRSILNEVQDRQP